MAAAGLSVELHRGARHCARGLLLAAYQNWRAAERDTALFALARPPAEPGHVAIGLIPASTLAN